MSTRKLIIQTFMRIRLKSLLQKLFSCHQILVQVARMFLHAFIRIIFICIEHHTLLQGMLVFHPEPCIPIPFLNSSHEPVPTQWRQHTMVDQELTVIQSGRQQLAYLNDSHHLSTRNRNTLHYPLYIFLQIHVQRLEYFCS